METLRENYPRFAYYSAMNSLGTHDTARILTLLGAEEGCEHQSKEWRSNYRLGPDQRRRAKELLEAGSRLMFAFPGSPTVYYGDEAGMEGFEDPFNRRTFPWGREDSELMGWFSRLGHLRKQSQALRQGDIHYRVGKGPVLALPAPTGRRPSCCLQYRQRGGHPAPAGERGGPAAAGLRPVPHRAGGTAADPAAPYRQSAADRARTGGGRRIKKRPCCLRQQGPFYMYRSKTSIIRPFLDWPSTSFTTHLPSPRQESTSPCSTVRSLFMHSRWFSDTRPALTS